MFLSWWHKVVLHRMSEAARRGRERRRLRSPRCRGLFLQQLEDRTLFTVTPTLSPTTGVLDISLDAATDTALISTSGSNLTVFDGVTSTSFVAGFNVSKVASDLLGRKRPSM